MIWKACALLLVALMLALVCERLARRNRTVPTWKQLTRTSGNNARTRHRHSGRLDSGVARLHRVENQEHNLARTETGDNPQHGGR